MIADLDDADGLLIAEFRVAEPEQLAAVAGTTDAAEGQHMDS